MAEGEAGGSSGMGGDRVLVLTCGGTIDKDYPDRLHGYEFQIAASRILEVMARVRPAFVVEHSEVCREDSLDMSDADREALARACATTPCKHVIVTHGTSTLVQSARAIKARLPIDKTVILTGALLPERFKDTDADFNLGLAFGALKWAPPNVYVALSGHVLPYDQVARGPEGHFVHLSHPEAQAGDDPGIQI